MAVCTDCKINDCHGAVTPVDVVVTVVGVDTVAILSPEDGVAITMD